MNGSKERMYYSFFVLQFNCSSTSKTSKGKWWRCYRYEKSRRYRTYSISHKFKQVLIKYEWKVLHAILNLNQSIFASSIAIQSLQKLQIQLLRLLIKVFNFVFKIMLHSSITAQVGSIASSSGLSRNRPSSTSDSSSLSRTGSR